jgi:hypothetical protein
VALWLGLYSYFGRFFVELSAMLALVSVTGLLGLGVLLSYLLTWNVQMIYGAAAEEVLGAALRREQRPAIFALGLLLCLLMLVPVLNLLLPALLCTSVCHLQRRSWHATGLPTNAE